MRLTPPEPEIPKEGFTESNDIFGYRPFAERLANLVQNIDEPLVIALDAPWGSGKSIFVKQWAGLVRSRGATVIEFDAFRSDHYEDAFLAISADVHATAKKQLGGNETTTRKFLSRAKKVGVALSPMMARVTARVGTAGFLSLEDVEASGEALKAAAKAIGDESAKALEKAVSDRLRKANEERAVLDVFRESLSELASKLAESTAETSGEYPLVVIVDELDRCRPPFALSVIERIKHLFSVPRVCFILVTHLPQLEQSVQGAYGTTFDAHTYLEKFYQIRLTLPAAENISVRQSATYIEHLWNALGIGFADENLGGPVMRAIQELAELHNLSLRRIERVMANVALASAAAAPNQLLVPSLVAGLCVMRQTHPELYKKAQSQEFNWTDARRFLTGVEPDVDTGGHAGVLQFEFVRNWWEFAAGKSISDGELGRFMSILSNYNVHERTHLLPLMTRYIDSLAQRNE